MGKDSWVELHAFGVAFGTPAMRPVLIFKDEDDKRALPVWLTPLEANLVIDEVSPDSLGDSPNAVGSEILKEAGIRVEKCIFTDLVGNRQYVNLELSGHPEKTSMRFRADHSMSFCLHSKARFFCTEEFIEQCRDLNEELQDIQLPPLVAEGLDPQHRYIM